MNAFAERWVRSIKSELLSRRIFFGTRSLEQALQDYLEFYNRLRPHQGLDNERIDAPPAEPLGIESEVAVDELQGGLLKSYRYHVPVSSCTCTACYHARIDRAPSYLGDSMRPERAFVFGYGYGDSEA